MGIVTSYVAYSAYVARINKEDRAAESYIDETEKKSPMTVKPTAGKPVVTPPRGYVASTFNPTLGNYSPASDIPEEQFEKEIKVLNIANVFTYG